ncbi:CHAD domain protein [Bordetella pertussis CHLA-20]|nr:CHAD domain protein [Bordetella pertussis CHLA-20]
MYWPTPSCPCWRAPACPPCPPRPRRPTTMPSRWPPTAPSRAGCWSCWPGAWTCRPRPPRPPRPRPRRPAPPSFRWRPPAEAAPPALRKRLTGRLRRWHLKVIDEGLRFGALELEARHELRKRVKRLRYGLSFAESLLPAARLRTYRKQLARVQDLLGEINDLAVARDYYQAALQAHPQAWFAVGWIGARLDGLTPQAQEAFDQLAHAKPFWK